MPQTIDGSDATARCRLESQQPKLELTVDLGVYPLEVVLGSGYVFVDRCFVFLDKPQPDRVRVSLTAKTGTAPDAFAAITGDFQNELLSQALRLQVGARHERVRELLIARALFGAAPEIDEGSVAGDEVAAGGQQVDGAADLPDDDDDYLDDPLGIAVPWEQRFADAPAAGTPAPSASGEVPAAPVPPATAAAEKPVESAPPAGPADPAGGEQH